MTDNIRRAAEAALDWFQRAPIAELEAVEAALEENAPIGLLTEALEEGSAGEKEGTAMNSVTQQILSRLAEDAEEIVEEYTADVPPVFPTMEEVVQHIATLNDDWYGSTTPKQVFALAMAEVLFQALAEGRIWLRWKPLFGATYPSGPPCLNCGRERTVAATAIEANEEVPIWRCPDCGTETAVDTDDAEGRMSQ